MTRGRFVNRPYNHKTINYESEAMNEKIRILAVAGATASGKSSLANLIVSTTLSLDI